MRLTGDEISILIGGKAGEGINQAGRIIAEILSGCGYNIFMIFDHPSLIKGGHNFSVIRGSKGSAGGISEKIDIAIALDKNTINSHKNLFSAETFVIFNSDKVKNVEGTGIPADNIVEDAGGIPIMVNSCLIGAFCKSAGFEWADTEKILKGKFPVKSDLNLAVAKAGFDHSEKKFILSQGEENNNIVISGSEAVGLGLCFGGIEGYIAYPMSPASGILHFLFSRKDEFGLRVFQPEGEIAAVLMAEGMACCGSKAAVGTSGGGFCLMNEGISYSGLAEVPVVIVNSQRMSPSTGAPTYTAQSDLSYVISAGHGEFPRIVVSPGNAEQAFVMSAKAVGLAWQFQVPVIVLTDLTLNDSLYSFNTENVRGENYDYPVVSAGKESYLRYSYTGDGISPIGFFNEGLGPVKINGKTHDESGISTDDPLILEKLAEKRLLKSFEIKQALEKESCIVTSGNLSSDAVVVSWGSNGCLCSEICIKMGLRSVQPVILHPFPKKQFGESVSGAVRTIVVEDNLTGQLSEIIKDHGFSVDHMILYNSGRQMTAETLEGRLKEVLK